MTKLVVTTFLSVDEAMQGAGSRRRPERGFDQGGWLVPRADEDMGRFVVDWIAEADGFLLGRKTYEIFAAHWPRIADEDDPVAAKLDTSPSTSPQGPRTRWSGTTPR